MVAPDAYQKGPEMPYFQLTLEDWSSVAAQVHCETMTAAVRPARTGAERYANFYAENFGVEVVPHRRQHSGRRC